MSEEKYKLSRLITYLYETMNGELAKDYAELDSENIELLLKELEEKDKEIERLNNTIDKKEQFLGDNIKRLEREVVKRDNIINELEKCIKFDYLEECEYQANIRKSDLMQGDYPVRYYYSEQNTKLQTKYLNKLQELKGDDKE